MSFIVLLKRLMSDNIETRMATPQNNWRG